jgi:predicted dehydrogenase
MGMTKKTFANRLITSAPHFGDNIDVDVDTHLTGCVEFASGAIARIIMTFDVYYSAQARFEVYGTEGTLVVPDPNTFGGPVLLYRPEDAEVRRVDPGSLRPEEISLYRGYRQMPLMFGYKGNSRGLGLADMCKAIESGRDHRANSRLQSHVLEILTSFEKSSHEKKYVNLTTSYSRSAPMKNAVMPGVLD